MKKIALILLMLLTTNLNCLAVITPEEAMSDNYLKNHGYSQETARLINLQNSQINGPQGDVQNNQPEYYSDKKVNFIRKVFIYLDPGLDDEKFGQHNTKFTPGWNDL